MATYYVAVANDDWYVVDLGAPTNGTVLIIASWSRIVIPNTSSVAYADVDTSAIGTDVISAASVKWDESSYTATRGLTKNYKIWMHDGSVWQLLQEYTYGRSPVVRTKVLNATQIGYIDKAGKTSFRWTESASPAEGEEAIFKLKAYETTQANACRMDITHAAPSGAITRTLLGVGL